MRHAEPCRHWSKSVASFRKHELDDLRSNRKDAIVTRLIGAGYKPELDYMGISWLQQQEKSLFRAKTLNNKEWDRICPDLVARLDPVRVRLLEDKVYGPRRKILTAEYAKYLQQPPLPGAAFDVMPNAADVAEFVPFRDIIMSPESTAITASSFISAFQQLPDFVPSWRAKIDHEFMDQFGANHDDHGKQSGSDILQLATAVFVMRCQNDQRLLMYPEVLLWPGFFFPFERDSYNWMSVSTLREEQFGCRTWSASGLPHLSTACVFEKTPALIQALGLDPMTTRREDMNRLDTRFACGACSSPDRKVVMKWDMAIIHSYRMLGHLPGQVVWTLIEGDELTNVKKYEQEAKHDLAGNAIVYCALCQHHIGDAQELRCVLNHLGTIHGIPSDKTEQGTHYILDCNSISTIVMVVDSDGNVSNHKDGPEVGSYSSGVRILRHSSHFV
ncbi:hypothetical protein K503DRAFT_506788 [Rhizopogon vinicolor AM-OR11-026]|uniref:Uncharacterized protein n=1 Tax=Rhizopogon vinicolor AM-OR11-026 TaxID=1314800 RepID=A0A1B7N962_9AGAM|nr:hypothetical protein K503DRAFT_506788 [Rhizopogon vinicolor AM-OR11-026]